MAATFGLLLSLLCLPTRAQQASPANGRNSRQKQTPSAGSTRAVSAPQRATVSSTGKHPLESLRVEGNQRLQAEKIIAVSGLKAGQPVAVDDFDGARERLLGTGAFENIGYSFTASKSGQGYDAVLQVVETGPLFHYRFEDLPASDEAMRAALARQETLFADAIPVTSTVLERYERTLAAFLGGNMAVEGRLRSDRPGEPQIVFRPPGDRPRISEVHFTGNQALPTERLAEKFFLAAVGLPYLEAEIRAVLDKSVRPMYEAKGRIGVAFTKLVAEKSREEGVDGVSVTIVVEEGPEYKLGIVRYAGVSEKESAALDKLASFPTNDTADFEVINAGLERIAKRYRGIGYLHASVKSERMIDDKEHTVNLLVTVAPGEKYRYGRLTIQGLDIIGEPAIRKAWGAREGTPFDPEFPAAFLKDLRDQAVFDNLGQTDSVTKVNEEDKSVDVTLIFKGARPAQERQRGGRGKF